MCVQGSGFSRPLRVSGVHPRSQSPGMGQVMTNNISSSWDHHIVTFLSPLGVTESFLYGVALVPLFCPAPFSAEDEWLTHWQAIVKAPNDLKETPKHL